MIFHCIAARRVPPFMNVVVQKRFSRFLGCVLPVSATNDDVQERFSGDWKLASGCIGGGVTRRRDSGSL